ncbi:MAG: cytochrome c [Candidatus Eremiobacteraeota bacterium]|nr:cytochrome c [Candidatus Eremiobacteraeota bacterium]NNM93210.1 cytochrome c [Candidatus Eremiobacteraeota bacterium]
MKNRAGIASLALLLTACSGHARSNGAGMMRGDGSRGRSVYLRRCAACHGADARGTRLGPALRALKSSWNVKRIFGAIEEPEAPMPKLYPSQLTRRELADVAAYIDDIAAEK